MGWAIKRKSDGHAVEYRGSEIPPHDPELFDVVECESLDAVKPLNQVAAEGVPQIVTGTQAKLALLHSGLYEAIEAWILGAEPQPDGIRYRIIWDAATWYRASLELAEIAASLGMTGGQVDDLFRLAATL